MNKPTECSKTQSNTHEHNTKWDGVILAGTSHIKSLLYNLIYSFEIILGQVYQ